MPRHSLIVIKEGAKISLNHSKVLNSKEELDSAFEEAKTRYAAKEDPQRETNSGSMGSHGLFKFANGQCRHNKKIELHYAIVEGVSSCGPRN